VIWSSLCRRLLLPVWQPKKESSIDGANSTLGIIAYLAQKHGGNIQDKGIITITARTESSFAGSGLRNLVAFPSDVCYVSGIGDRQWLSWDFHEMRVRLTRYAITAYQLKSWVVEGSLDGTNWTEIDRRTDTDDFKTWNTASFAVSNEDSECRFIRLTQTGISHGRSWIVHCKTVEFFGTLLE
jgi:hypothetical protein